MLHEQFFDSDKDELVTTWNLFIMFEKSSWFINAQMHYTVIWINDLFSYFFPLQSSLESDVEEKTNFIWNNSNVFNIFQPPIDNIEAVL